MLCSSFSEGTWSKGPLEGGLFKELRKETKQVVLEKDEQQPKGLFHNLAFKTMFLLMANNDLSIFIFLLPSLQFADYSEKGAFWDSAAKILSLPHSLS